MTSVAFRATPLFLVFTTAALGEIAVEDMARVYREFDSAFLASTTKMTDPERGRLVELVNEGILAFWGQDSTQVMRSFSQARQIVLGEEYDASVDRLDSIRLVLGSPIASPAAAQARLRLEAAYVPTEPGPVEVEIRVDPLGDESATPWRERATVDSAELARGWTAVFPVLSERSRIEVVLHCGKRRQTRERMLFRVANLEGRLAELRRGIESLPDRELALDLEAAFQEVLEQIDPTTAPPVWIDVVAALECLESDLATARSGADPLADRRGVVLRATRTRTGEFVVYRVVLPADYDPSVRYPVVAGLHGLGIDERTITHTYGAGALAREATGRGYILVAPRSSRTQTGESLTLRDSSENDHVLAALDHAAIHYSIDPERVFVFGHSLGAIQALQTAAREPQRFAGVAAVGLSAVVNPARLKKMPILLLWGEEDPMALAIRAFEIAARLAGCEKLLARVVPRAGHVLILHFEMETVFDFFDVAAGAPADAYIRGARALASGDVAAFASGLSAEAASALAAPPAASALEDAIRGDPELARLLADRYSRVSVEKVELTDKAVARIVVRFGDGTSGTRTVVRQEGRWRVEWDAGNWTSESLPDF